MQATKRLKEVMIVDLCPTAPPDKGSRRRRGGFTMCRFDNRYSKTPKRFVCVGGYVSTGSGREFVSCSRLPALYGVSPRECLFVPDSHAERVIVEEDGTLTGSPKVDGLRVGEGVGEVTLLRPDPTGEYRGRRIA